MLNKFLAAYHLTVEFTLDEFEHWFLPREGVIYSWVVANPKTGLITDFISFYHLPSSILNHDKYKTLKAAYSFYNVSGTFTSSSEMQRYCVCVDGFLPFFVLF